METLAVAYAVAWGLVGAYLGWLAVQNRQLARRLDELHAHREREATQVVWRKAG